jgi:hypothetical protein
MSTPRCCSGVVVAAVLALCACPRPKEDAEAYAARNAVIRYNQALVEAFRASRADLLSSVATEDEISRVAAIIAGLARNEQFMVARQTSFEVTRTTLEPPAEGGAATAQVSATEAWSYQHRALSSRDAPTPPKTASYRLTYLLRRGEAGWLVGRILDEDHPRAGETH